MEGQVKKVTEDGSKKRESIKAAPEPIKVSQIVNKEDNLNLKLADIVVDSEKDEQLIVREFFVRFANFLAKKNMTLYGVLHHKIYDKMFNGVEIELITAKHFWRLLHKVAFRTLKREREAVTNM